MKESSLHVKSKIAPIIETLRPGWKVYPVEGEGSELSKILDVNCGIDYLMCSEKSDLVYGIASRVQYGENYRTFTVRKARETSAKTEYDKRKTSITLNGIYPEYTMQAYVLEDKVRGLGVIKTKDLIEAIDLKQYSKVLKTHDDKIGQAEFYVCNWDVLKYFGYKVFEYQN